VVEPSKPLITLTDCAQGPGHVRLNVEGRSEPVIVRSDPQTVADAIRNINEGNR
jgi:hypothetical protein